MFVGGGGRIFEDTQVVAIDEGDPCRVISERGVVMAREVIVAAHVPISNRVLLHTKLAAYRTYVVGVELGGDAGVADGLYWDMAEPYHYIRAQAIGGRRYLMVGGEDHKVGEARRHGGAVRTARDASCAYSSGATSPPPTTAGRGRSSRRPTGCPYVGRNSLSADVFVATGYARQRHHPGDAGGDGV